jgi:cell shape-determining protein MreC
MFEKRSKKTYPYIGLILLLIIGLHYTGLLGSFENFLRSLLIAPFTSVHSLSVQTGNDYQFFKDKASFMEAYQQCVLDAGVANVYSAQIKLLEKDNAELRKQLDFKQKQVDQTVAADVIGNNLDGTEQTLVINRGTAGGWLALCWSGGRLRSMVWYFSLKKETQFRCGLLQVVLARLVHIYLDDIFFKVNKC